MSTRRMMVASEPKGIVKDGIIQDSWKTIVNVCQSGEADKYYTVGDKAPMAFGENAFNMVYTGSGLDPRADGSGNPVTTWIADTCVMRCYFGNSFVADPWSKSLAREICNTILSVLFELTIGGDLVEVSKTHIVGKYNATENTVDKVFIPSRDEISSIYKANFPSNVKPCFTSTACTWWTRESSTYTNYFYDSTGKAGGLNTDTTNDLRAYYLLPCFCL